MQNEYGGFGGGPMQMSHGYVDDTAETNMLSVLELSSIVKRYQQRDSHSSVCIDNDIHITLTTRLL
jgi:hypothetical protein